ncbi:MAG: hypothetical protein RLZ98_1914 [Pseudomonadota bacterium]|jgi:hypothetical protein
MLSESRRNATAEEAAYRISYPNSRPRTIKVIALDKESAAMVEEIAKMDWERAVFFNSASFGGTLPDSAAVRDGSLKGWLNDLAGHARDLVAEIDDANIIVMVVHAGSDARVGALIGEAAYMRKKSVIGLVMDAEAADDKALARTMKGMRPFSKMLVVARGHDYIEEMLHALSA